MSDNVIKTLPIRAQNCPSFSGSEGFSEYLGDESRMAAESVESVFFPENIAQIAGVIEFLNAKGKSAVASGGRTGITAAASPIGANAVISLEKMNRILALSVNNGEYYVRLEPGVSLRELENFLQRGAFNGLPQATEKEHTCAKELTKNNTRLWFPVNPTETSAHIGGVIANNASGSRTFRYGCAREWVRALKIVLPTGDLLEIRRGNTISAGKNKREFILKREGRPDTVFSAPMLTYPAVKCTCGYFSGDYMDAIDLFVGSEGTLGIICEIELRLIVKPAQTCGIVTFCRDEAQAIKLVSQLRDNVNCDAIEYFDKDSLNMIQQSKPGVFNIPAAKSFAVYCELNSDSCKIDQNTEQILHCLGDCGIIPEQTWATDDAQGLRLQKDFRHAIPEAVNSLIGRRKKDFPQLHKVGTDMAVPFENLSKMFEYYRKGLTTTGLQSVIFGHIGDGHVHVNILPQNPEQLAQAKELYTEWAEAAVNLGGSVAAEHGIGRIKKSMVLIQYNKKIIEQMNNLRRTFDPKNIFSPGVLF